MLARRQKLSSHATCPSGQRLYPNAKTFPLQNQLIFETIPLTAEAPVSRPCWLGYPDCPCTTLVLRRAPRLAIGFRAEGAGRGRSSILGISRFPRRKISFTSISHRSVSVPRVSI